MATSAETINSFFEKFPFKQNKQFKTIDYQFFESSIPKILSDKQIHSIYPPNLNIFEGFNLGKHELKHCSLLAWFFNPGGNHSQGQLFLYCFLEKFELREISKYTQEGYFTVSTEDSYSEQGRVDITIYSKNFWLIIEAKVFANEQDDQIERYNEILNNKSIALGIPRSMCKIFFLTVDGRNPISGKADFCVSWKDIAEVLQNFSTKCKNDYISSTAMQYSKFIISYLGENYV